MQLTESVPSWNEGGYNKQKKKKIRGGGVGRKICQDDEVEKSILKKGEIK